MIGERIRARFTALQKHYPVIGDVRGIGAMAAMELVEDPETKKPAGDFAKAFRAKLYENGVVNVGAGTYPQRGPHPGAAHHRGRHARPAAWTSGGDPGRR